MGHPLLPETDEFIIDDFLYQNSSVYSTDLKRPSAMTKNSGSNCRSFLLDDTG